METTQVPAENSAAEITRVLVIAGASQISTEYKDGRIAGLRWIMRVGAADQLFEMPARVEPVYKTLRKRVKRYCGIDREAALKEQAVRVAWRQLLRWVQAQVAMIECGMTEAGEVFFPYLHVPHRNQSLFAMFKENGPKLFAAGDPQ